MTGSMADLTYKDVFKLLDLIRRGERYDDIGELFGVSGQSVYKYVRKRVKNDDDDVFQDAVERRKESMEKKMMVYWNSKRGGKAPRVKAGAPTEEIYERYKMETGLDLDHQSDLNTVWCWQNGFIPRRHHCRLPPNVKKAMKRLGLGWEDLEKK